MLDLAIIIVQYNVRDLLRDCLRSIAASAGDFTRAVWVVDSCSTDGSADMVAAEFPWVRLIRAPVNGGYSYANNLGLRAAGLTPLAGEAPRSAADALPPDADTIAPRYVLLLNPDTLLPPTALRDMLAFMDAHPDAGAAGPRLVLADGSLDLACRRAEPTLAVSASHLLGLGRLFPRSRIFGRYNLTYLPEDQLARVDSVVGAFMIVRVAALQHVGLLDERFFMYAEDLDWARRLRERGWAVYYNPDVIVRHYKRQSSQQSRRAQFEWKRALLLYYQKHYRLTTPLPLHWLVVAAFAAWGGPRLGREALRPARGHA